MYSMIMLKNKFISFLLFAIVTYSASFIGSIATISYKEPWYSSLNKSFLTPPDWVFAPVWTTLYILMYPNGKIVELAVKNIIEGHEIKNKEALANPDILEEYKNIRELNV